MVNRIRQAAECPENQNHSHRNASLFEIRENQTRTGIYSGEKGL
jgi:type II secretory pathway component PulJ